MVGDPNTGDFSAVVYRMEAAVPGQLQGDVYARPRVCGNAGWVIVPRHNTERLPLNQHMIRRYWAPILCRRPWYKFDTVSECCEANYCFACGAEYPVLDAAHIVPIWSGGSNQPSNVPLLCPGCHAISECVGGLRYWRWFKWWRMGKMLRFWSGDAIVEAEMSLLLGRVATADRRL